MLWRVAELELAGLSAIAGLVWDRAIAGEFPPADLRRVLAWLRSALADIDLADGVLSLARERAMIIRGLAADVEAMWPDVEVDGPPAVVEADLPPPDALAALRRSICRHAPPQLAGGASSRPAAGRCVVST